MQQVSLNARGFAFTMVSLTCIFVMLWVAVSPSVHKNYEMPSPVRNSLFVLSYPFLLVDTARGQDCCWISSHVPLYFWAEGFWSIDRVYMFQWWNIDQRVEYTQRRAALGMLL